ncbi:MAG: homocysteine S-methyltransferase family protein [Candidatus Tectomicrobia bacterium]|uniref:Homocysteine S-methyltransferase family protein n=1 Tax=Tectimicrobiota bacterium TaxID=2528274 RepID=A0A933GJB9_UNCTE|nr:homocysteine S-methyltransferase family protein [Candidatus Tectomicrobia bacterium]
MRRDFLELIERETIIFDGAMGTMLQMKGLAGGDCPELWNRKRPDVIREIHQAYFLAGCQVVETNTFGANSIKLKSYDLEDQVYELNYLGARLARESAPAEGFVAASIGPTGKFLEPLGNISREKMYSVFKEQIEALIKGGVDIICIETMMDLEEAKLAVQAAKENSSLPIIATMTFDLDRNGFRTMMGVDPKTAIKELGGAGVDVLGANCGNGPKEMVQLMKEMRDITSMPLIAQPNAGLPQLKEGKTVFSLNPEDFASYVRSFKEVGLNILGGCCGTTPQHMKKVVEIVKGE